LVTYATQAGGDLPWDLGLGCGGVVHILLEPLPASSPLLGYWRDCLQKRQPGVVMTVYRGDGRWPVGARTRLGADGLEGFPEDLTRHAREVLHTGRGTSLHYGDLSVALERLSPPRQLVICGAGLDAIPLARLAKELGWDVTVRDRRAAHVQTSRFPTADHLVVADPERASVEAEAAAVVMSHHYLEDCAYLRALLRHSPAYVGVLGPRHRSVRMLAQLQAEGAVIDPSRLFVPVGLDIGAETPEEIALAIVSEIQAVFAQRSAGFLRSLSGRSMRSTRGSDGGPWRLCSPGRGSVPRGRDGG